MVPFQKYSAVSHKKIHLLCIHHTMIIYSMVGRSIASISDLGALHLSKYGASDQLYRLQTSLLYYIQYIANCIIDRGTHMLLGSTQM